MDHSVQRSCWSITAWAIVAFALLLVMAYVLAGGDPIAVAAAG